MKVHTYKTDFCQIIDDFKRNRPWILLFGLVPLLLALAALINYSSNNILEVNLSAIQFGFSLTSIILLLYIGLFLLFNGYRPVWGISFLVYSISFLGLSLRALKFPITNISNPIVFQVWILPMIAFISGIHIGIKHLLSENEKFVYVPSVIILILGECWFIFGSLVLRNIEFTIFGLSIGLIVPLLFYFAYNWYRLGKNSDFIPTSVLAFGFFIMGITYIFWNPWLIDILGIIYYLIFTIYNISLIIIGVGFFDLKKDLLKV